MDVFHALILGIVQGLTEFLPVSSSGHLSLFQTIFGLKEANMLFDVILHVGTLIPVLVVFRKDVLDLIRNPFQKMTVLLILATLPTVIVTLLFGDFIGRMFESSSFLWLGFFTTGIFLIYADTVKNGKKTSKKITGIDALIIGCMQAIAITPSISRSGATITGALARNIDRETAAKFSFLMSIPAIAGAVVLQIKDIITGEVLLEQLSILPVLFGFVAAALSGYLAVNFMMKLIKASKLKYFSCYLFVLGAFILFDQLVTHFIF